MTGPRRETSGVELGVSLDLDPDLIAAAASVLLRGYDLQQLDATQARDALEMIGFLPYEAGGKYAPFGKRVTQKARLRPSRRKATRVAPESAQSARTLTGVPETALRPPTAPPRGSTPHPRTAAEALNGPVSHDPGRSAPVTPDSAPDGTQSQPAGRNTPTEDT